MLNEVKSVPKPMLDAACGVVAKLRKSGYTDDGITTVLDLLAREHEEGSDKYVAYTIAKSKVV